MLGCIKEARNQSTYCRIPHNREFKNNQIDDDRHQNRGYPWGAIWTEKQGSLYDAENVPYLDISGSYTGVYICKQSSCTPKIVHSEYLAVCMFHLQTKTSLKEDTCAISMLCIPHLSDRPDYFYSIAVTKMSLHLIIVVCLSLFLFLLLYHILPSLLLQAPRFSLIFLSLQ